jgi:hypothetical protein
MKAERNPSGSRPGRGLILPPLVGLWPAGVASDRGKALVLPNMVLETGYKPTYRKRQRESDFTMRVAYLDFSLSPFLPVTFLFLDHKQAASVAALVLRDSSRIRRPMLSYRTAKRMQCHCRMHLLTEISSARSKLCHLQNKDEYKFTVRTGRGV